MLPTEHDPDYNPWVITPNVKAALDGGCSVVFNFTSLANLHYGCGVFTDGKQSFDQWSKRKVKAPIFCTYGVEKVGKTFCTGRLMGKKLPADAVLNTPGLCITTLEKKKVLVKSPVKYVGTAGKAKAAATISQEDEFALLAIDTEGSLAPTHVLDYDLKKATETLTRIVSLGMCQRIVLVINKWDANAQDQLRMLLKQQSQLLSSKRKFTRVIVIHNYKDLEDPDTLGILMQKVEECYVTREGHENDPSNEGWDPLDHEDIFWFKTKSTCHFFLAKEDPSNEWATENNRQVFTAIKVELTHTDAVEVNIFEEFRKNMAQQLHWYLSEWNSACTVEFKPPVDEDPNSGLLISGTLVPADRGDKFVPRSSPYLMNKMKFGETGAVSETIAEISRTWRVNRDAQEIIIKAETRGFTSEHLNCEFIRYKFDIADRALHFDFVLPQQEWEEGFEEDSAAPVISSSQGFFSCYFPDYIFPEVNPQKPEELFNGAYTKNGVTYLKLKYKDFSKQ